MSAPDVVIMGAGVAGCAIAAHLVRLEPGLRVELLDRHHVGAGSSSRSTAAFRHQWSIAAHVAFSAYASGEYDRLAALGYPIQFRRNGYLFLFTDPERLSEARTRVEQQRSLGVEGVEVLAPEDLPSRVPGGDRLDLEILAGATWGPRDGFLDPLAVAQAYLDEARNAGVRYRPGAPVTRLETDPPGTRVTGVALENGSRMEAGHVVNAGGVWSHSLAEAAGVDLPIRPAKRYLYHSRPLESVDVLRWPMLIGHNAAHLRPSEGNTLMMAWEHRPDPLPGMPAPDRLWDDQDVIAAGFGTGPEGYGIRILTELSRHVPVLAETVSLSRVTCGWYCVTPDHKAILGPDPRRRGLLHATGFSGHGVMHAAATGLTLAEMILGRKPTLASMRDLESHFGLAPLLDGRLREPVETMVL